MDVHYLEHDSQEVADLIEVMTIHLESALRVNRFAPSVVGVSYEQYDKLQQAVTHYLETRGFKTPILEPLKIRGADILPEQEDKRWGYGSYQSRGESKLQDVYQRVKDDPKWREALKNPLPS